MNSQHLVEEEVTASDAVSSFPSRFCEFMSSTQFGFLCPPPGCGPYLVTFVLHLGLVLFLHRMLLLPPPPDAVSSCPPPNLVTSVLYLGVVLILHQML